LVCCTNGTIKRIDQLAKKNNNNTKLYDLPRVLFLEGHVLLFALLLHVVEGHVGLARKNNRGCDMVALAELYEVQAQCDRDPKPILSQKYLFTLMN